ncbi:MAG TPA: peptidase M24 family protein, partial [Actinobacteria bacterium]|nr:peptidase M24 family protein [Actinomycetota bacterium]
MKHAARLDALRSSLTAPLLVTRLPNLQYLTGFTGSNGFLLVRPEGTARFITDGRYGEMAEGLVAQLDSTELTVYTSGLWDVLRAATAGLGPLGLEADGVMWSFATDFAREIGVPPVASPGAVERLRRRKDAEEVAALAAAAAAGDA